MSANTKTTRRWPRRVVILTATLGALAASVGVATATIPGSDGAISGCYNATDGTLRVIDAPTFHCKATERPLQWNVAGPQGVQGPQGAPGAAGPAGAQGPRGSLGFETVTSNLDVGNLNGASVNLWCPTGKLAISGGYYADSDHVQSVDMKPYAAVYSFYFYNNDLLFHHNATAYVICGRIG